MHAFVRLFLPALLALAAVASPAADAPAMPDGCLVHLSVGPFTQVVANLDAAVATAVRKARGGYPAGIVGTMLPVLYPFALGDWRRDQPVHLLLFHADRPRMAAVIAVDDFVAFRNSLIEHRQPIETETNLPFAFRGWLRDGSAYWCAPLAGGRAILADDAPTIERLTVAGILDRWQPTHPADADLCLTVDLDPLLSAFAAADVQAEITRRFSIRFRGRARAALHRIGVDGVRAEALTECIEAAFPILLREAVASGHWYGKCSLAEDLMSVRVGFRPQPGTLAAALVRPAAADALCRTRVVPPTPDGDCLTFAAAPPRLPPEWIAGLAAVTAPLERAYPEHIPEVRRLLADLADRQAEPGPSGSWYLDEAAAGGIVFFPTDDPDGFLAGVTALVAVVGDLIRTTSAELAALAPVVLPERCAGRDLVSIRCAAADAVLDRLIAATGAEGGGMVPVNRSLRVRLLPLTGMVAVLVDTGPENDRVQQLVAALEADLPSPLATAAGREALDALRLGDTIAAVADPYSLLYGLTCILARAGGFDASVQFGLAALWPKLRQDGRRIGIGVGLDDGHPALELTIPTATVGTVARNGLRLAALFKAGPSSRLRRYQSGGAGSSDLPPSP